MRSSGRPFFALIASAALLFAVAASGAPVKFETAESAARKRLESRRGGGGDKISRGAAHKTKASFTPYYVFEKENEGGFIIVAADDAAAPILGETDGGVFDKDSMPPALVWLLGTYERQIEEAVKGGAARDGGTRALWERLADGSTAALRRSTADAEARYPLRMLSTTWDQREPYNLKAPLDGDARSQAGCVATAMAQIMKYRRHPAVGTGASAAYSTSAKNINVPAVDFNVRYDYENMLDDYPDAGGGTAAQRDAVSTLVYHSGVSVKTDYAQTESVAYSEDAAAALVNNFDYDGSLRYIESLRGIYNGVHISVSDDDWKDLVLGQMENNSPVYYSGYDSASGGDNGHAFIIDGYDADADAFHINWGWGGKYDGFFALTALNPNDRKFNAGRRMIINIMPPSANGVRPSQLKVTGFDVSVTQIPVTISAKVTVKMNYGVEYSGLIGFAVMRGDTVDTVLDYDNFRVYYMYNEDYFADSDTYVARHSDLYFYKRVGADTALSGDVALRPVIKRFPDDAWTPIGEARSVSIPAFGPMKVWDCGESEGSVTAELYKDGTLIVYGNGKMKDYSALDRDNKSDAPWWNDYRSFITKAVVAEGVTSIGRAAFFRCEKLTTVDISNSVEFIGDVAFYGCDGLTSVISLNPVPPEIYGKETFNVNKPSGCLYVPPGSVDVYASAFGWGFFDCINPLPTAAVLAPGRAVPPSGPSKAASAAAAPPVLTAEFAAGPNPAGAARAAAVRFFRGGARIAPAALSIYDASGGFVKKIAVSDDAPAAAGRRAVASWDLTDKKGRPVPDGAYLARGAVKTKSGKAERVSIVVAVRRGR